MLTNMPNKSVPMMNKFVTGIKSHKEKLLFNLINNRKSAIKLLKNFSEKIGMIHL